MLPGGQEAFFDGPESRYRGSSKTVYSLTRKSYLARISLQYSDLRHQDQAALILAQQLQGEMDGFHA